VGDVAKQVWFYDDGCSARRNKKTRERCKEVLEVFKRNGDISNLIYDKG
jgi:hypothetical protein